MNYILALIIGVVVLVFGLAALNQSAAELEIARARGDAIRIEAKATAQATVILALVPWGIILGLAVPATILALKYQPRRQPMMPPREVHFVIEPGQPRRALWNTYQMTAGHGSLLESRQTHEVIERR